MDWPPPADDVKYSSSESDDEEEEDEADEWCGDASSKSIVKYILCERERLEIHLIEGRNHSSVFLLLGVIFKEEEGEKRDCILELVGFWVLMCSTICSVLCACVLLER